MLLFYSSLGFGDDSSLMSAAIAVDKFGRRVLFLEGGLQMIICQIDVGSMIGLKFGTNGQGSLSESEADLLLLFICAYVAAFTWPWGPLGWLVPSEICPLEIQAGGQAINVSVNMLLTFLTAEGFLTFVT